MVVEAFAMGGRAAALTVEYAPNGTTAAHFFAAQDITLQNVSVWEMGCGSVAPSPGPLPGPGPGPGAHFRVV